MPLTLTTEGQRARTPRWARRELIALVATVATAAFAVVALGRSPATLGTAKNATIGGAIVVDAHGLTVYELRPETTRHLLCTKVDGCFQAWPPVRIASATAKLTAARGVRGKLGIIRRNGIFQVTLGGHPLYRFAGDASTRGTANGQGIHSFGGVWHVVGANFTTNSSQPRPTSTTTATTAPYTH
jgi:predicted lipoprotein with Yx(FWY)xxD motif